MDGLWGEIQSKYLLKWMMTGGTPILGNFHILSDILILYNYKYIPSRTRSCLESELLICVICPGEKEWGLLRCSVTRRLYPFLVFSKVRPGHQHEPATANRFPSVRGLADGFPIGWGICTTNGNDIALFSQ